MASPRSKHLDKHGKPQGRWITTDEGHHVFISSKGELLIHGPGSKVAPGRGTPERATTAARVATARKAFQARQAKDGMSKTAYSTRDSKAFKGVHATQAKVAANDHERFKAGREAEKAGHADAIMAHVKAGNNLHASSMMNPRIYHPDSVRRVGNEIQVREGTKAGKPQWATLGPGETAASAGRLGARGATPAPAPAATAKPAEKFRLAQRSATGAAPIGNRPGTQGRLFGADPKPSRDLPGQRTMFDKGPAKDVAKLVHADRSAGRPELKPVQQTPREALSTARERTALKLSQLKKVADVQAHPETHAQPGDVVNMKTGAIHFDPDRFQYKLSGSGEHGVSTQLHQVKNWNQESAGVLSVWKDPANGKTFVINGHHRLDLANRLGVEKVTARFIDAPDAVTARMKGAITNIAEGRGTPIDAAKFFRDAGIGRAAMDVHGIPMTEATAKHGLNMAGLNDRIFKRVVNQEIPVERASILGGSGLSHEHQDSVLAQATKMKASNATLRELVDNAKSAPTITQRGRSLFGDTEDEVSLAGHRATVQASISMSLSGDKKLFGLVSKSKAAASLEERGRSHIDTEETGKVSSESAQVMGVFHELKNRSGPVARELNRAAERLHAGENQALVLKEARHAVTGHVRNLLSGGASAFD